MINFLVNSKYIFLYLSKIYKRLIFMILSLFLLRLGYFINIPFINNINNIKNKFLYNNLFSIFSAGSINNLSILSIGITSYVSSCTIIKFFSFIFPNLFDERNNLIIYLIYFFINIIESIIFIKININNFYFKYKINYLISLLSIIIGSNVLVWISKKIDIYGISNGNSFIILISIINNIIYNFYLLINYFKVLNLFFSIKFILYLFIFFLLLYIIIFIEFSYKKIFINFSNRYYGINNNSIKTYIPIKINISGMNSYIFSYNLFFLIKYIFLLLYKYTSLVYINKIYIILDKNVFVFKILNCLFIFLFSYFNTLNLYNPKNISNDLLQSGAFIEGIKPGINTEIYINSIIKEIVIINSVYLNVIYLILDFLKNIIYLENDISYLLIFFLIIIDFIMQFKYYLIPYKYDIILKKMNLK